MKEEWMKLIDDVENDRSYNADPNFNFFDFIREKTTIEDKRAIVQEVERRVKKVVNREVNNPDYFFRNFSESERELLDDLLGLREVTLDDWSVSSNAVTFGLRSIARLTRWTTVSATTWTVRFDSSMLTKTRSCIWRMMTITVPTSTI